MKKVNREQLVAGQKVFSIDAFGFVKLLGTVATNENGNKDGRTMGVVHLGSWKKTILADVNGDAVRLKSRSCWVAN